MTAVKIGSFVGRLTVHCITLVSCLSVSASSRKVQEVTSSQLLGSLLQCGLDWQLELRKSTFVLFILIISSQCARQLSSRKKTNQKNEASLTSLSLSLSMWSSDHSSVRFILQLSGSTQPCLPPAYLNTKLHNEVIVKKGKKKGQKKKKWNGRGRNKRRKESKLGHYVYASWTSCVHKFGIFWPGS